MALQEFYTFVKDIRPFGDGSPVGYNYDPTWTGSSYFEASLGDIVSGELVAWDATNRRIVRYAGDDSTGKLAGISRDSAQGIKKLGNQAALTANLDFVVFTSGIHELLGSVGDTYFHGDAVYMSGTNTQAITKTQASGYKQVGKVFLPGPTGSSKVGAVRVPVLIDSYVSYAS